MHGAIYASIISIMDRFVQKRPKAMSQSTTAAETSEDRRKKPRRDAGRGDIGKGAENDEGVVGGAASSSGGFQMLEIKGDLFGCPEVECLAHCISQDVRMGKGIAKIFKEKYGGVKELISQGVKPGGVAVLRRRKRFIYYLVTKEKYWNKPTYDSLARSLRAMADHCAKNNVSNVSMPRIGCGLDGLRWEKVAGVIRDVLGKTNVTITVYTL